MVSRLPRLWQPGAPQTRVFLPDFWVAAIKTPKIGRNRLPPNCAKFEVDPRMSRHDVREYLTKVYELPVRDVRIEVQMGDITWNSERDYQYKKALWKEEDRKIAYVFMSKEFKNTWPDLYSSDEEQKSLDQVKKATEATRQNAAYVNQNRTTGKMLS